METALLVMEIVALAAFSALCFFLIVVLFRVKSLLELVEKDLKEVSAKAIPILENLESITGKIKLIVEAIGDQVDSLKSSFTAVQEIAESLVAFERRVQEAIEEPVMGTVSAIASVFRGIQSLFDRLPFVSRLRAE